MWDTLLGVCIGVLLWLMLVCIYAYLRFFGIYILKWKTLEDSPFLIPTKERVRFVLDKKNRIIKTKESAEWLVEFIRGVLFTENGDTVVSFLTHKMMSSPMDTSRVFGSLLECIQVFDVILKDARFSLLGLSIHIPDDQKSSFVITSDLKFAGSLAIEASGASRSLAKPVDITAQLSQFSGKIHVAFHNATNPTVLVSSSSMPEISFEASYGDQIMGRLSNLALLVLKSLINSHLIYSNAVPILFRDEQLIDQKPFELPISLFNSTFLKILHISVDLPTSQLEAHPYMSCHLMFSGQKARTLTTSSMSETTWSFVHKFPIGTPFLSTDMLPLQVKIYTKKKRNGQSVLLEEFIINIDASSSSSLIKIKSPLSRIAGGYLRAEFVLVTPDLCKNLVPPQKIDPENTIGGGKYLNGMSWSNLKTALQSLVVRPTKEDLLIFEQTPAIIIDSAEKENEKVLEKLRFYEHQIVNILHFLTDHDHTEGTSLAPIQMALEAFRVDIVRMIETYPDCSHTAEEIDRIIQSFIGLVTQKISKIDENDQTKEVLQPIETHLKSFLPVDDVMGPLSDFGSPTAYDIDTPTKRKKTLYEHENLVASAPLVMDTLGVDEFKDPIDSGASEFLCHVGSAPVSMILGEESIVMEDLQNETMGTEHSFKVFSLAESYGLELSLAAIESHQFTKKWILTVADDRICLTSTAQLSYFPYICISVSRLLKIKAYEASKDRSSGVKAPFIEIYYLQDEDQNIVEYQKVFAESNDIAQIYDLLQKMFIFKAGVCEIHWSCIEKIDLTGSAITIYMNPTFDPSGVWEAVKIGRFFGTLDIHGAYCELQARIHKKGRSYSPMSASLSPLNSSTTSLAFSIDNRRDLASYHLYRPSLPALGHEFHQYSINNFGLICPTDSVEEYYCSYLRRGINVGRLVLTPNFFCFNGKRNGVRTSKLIAKWSNVESIEYDSRWYSRGFVVQLTDVPEQYYFFGFRKESLADCYAKITNFIENWHK